MKREFKVECNQGKYLRLTIRRLLLRQLSRETYKKQSGGRGKFAFDIIVNIGPKDEDYKEGDCSSSTKLKVVTFLREFIPSVQKGFRLQ